MMTTTVKYIFVSSKNVFRRIFLTNKVFTVFCAHYLGWHLKGVKANTPIAINIGVVDFCYKLHFWRVEWIPADNELILKKQ